MRDHCKGDRSLEAVLLARRGVMAAVRSTRDCPREGLLVFAEDRKGEVVLGGQAVLHSTLKLLEHVELSRACVGSRINASKARQGDGLSLAVGRRRTHPTRHVVFGEVGNCR